MPSGEMRRAPQLWEQRLARVTSILGVGISSSGDATAVVPPEAPPGSGGGTEPAPVLPAPGAFIAPSTPTLIGSVQGINVVWNGLNSAGDLWPSDTSWVEVHMSTAGTGFSPSSSTLKGRLARPGGLAVTGLTAATTYYFKLRGADPAGNYTTASTAASGQPGLINAPDIAANAITANSIVAGTITGWSINSAYLSGGTISGGYITGGTIDGANLRTGSSGARIEMGNAFGVLSAINFYQASNLGGAVTTSINDNGLTVTASTNKLTLIGNTVNVQGATDFDNGVTCDSTLAVTGQFTSGASGGNAAFRVNSDDVFSYGIEDNTSANAANVRIGTSAQLLKSTSTQRVKTNMAPLADALPGVDPAKLATDPASVNPYDVLDVVPTEFESLAPSDNSQRILGFIAENVAEVFPWAAEWDAEGLPSSVADRPILAALLAVVRDQHNTITDLRTRIEALEA